jgi:hypothetical protein
MSRLGEVILSPFPFNRFRAAPMYCVESGERPMPHAVVNNKTLIPIIDNTPKRRIIVKSFVLSRLINISRYFRLPKHIVFYVGL